MEALDHVVVPHIHHSLHIFYTPLVHSHGTVQPSLASSPLILYSHLPKSLQHIYGKVTLPLIMEKHSSRTGNPWKSLYSVQMMHILKMHQLSCMNHLNRKLHDIKRQPLFIHGLRAIAILMQSQRNWIPNCFSGMASLLFQVSHNP